MPSAVIIIILGQTLSDRIVWGSPQRRLGEDLDLVDYLTIISQAWMGYWLRGHKGKRNNKIVKSNLLVKNMENYNASGLKATPEGKTII